MILLSYSRIQITDTHIIMLRQQASETEHFENQLQNNLCRALILLGRQVEISTISALRKKGHHELAMAYGSPMAILGNSAPRVTELAEMLGMSKQLCLQTLKPFEHAGYIYREPDPEDGRAKRVRLSSQGRRMIKQGLKELDKLSLEYENVLGKRKLQKLSKIIGKISFDLSTQPDHLFADFRQKENPLPSFLVRTAQQIEKRIIDTLKIQGYSEITIAQSRILMTMSGGKNRIQPIAQSNGISQQSVARTLRDLESSGFVLREKDPEDQRNKLISLTAKGHNYLQTWIQTSEKIQSLILEADLAGTDSLKKDSKKRDLIFEGISNLYNHFFDEKIQLHTRARSKGRSQLLNSQPIKSQSLNSREKSVKTNSQILTKQELLLIIARQLELLESAEEPEESLIKIDADRNICFSKKALANMEQTKLNELRLNYILSSESIESLTKTLALNLS